MLRAIEGPQILRSKNDPQTHFTQNMLARLQFPEPSEGWRRRPILFSAIVPATLSISRPIIPWVPHFALLVKMEMRKPPNDILSHRSRVKTKTEETEENWSRVKTSRRKPHQIATCIMWWHTARPLSTWVCKLTNSLVRFPIPLATGSWGTCPTYNHARAKLTNIHAHILRDPRDRAPPMFLDFPSNFRQITQNPFSLHYLQRQSTFLWKVFLWTVGCCNIGCFQNILFLLSL